MDQVNSVLDSLLKLIISLGNIIVDAIVSIELWMRTQLTTMGLSPQLQTVVLVVLAIVLIVAALRLFGGLVRIAVILVLALIAVQILMPVLHA
jgi:hypothetical protein